MGPGDDVTREDLDILAAVVQGQTVARQHDSDILAELAQGKADAKRVDDSATEADGKAIVKAAADELDSLAALVERPSGAETIVVSATEDADYPTIKAAVAAAKPGSVILVRPGTYTGTVEIAKSITIVGDGPAASAVIKTTKDHGLVVTGSNVVVRSLTASLACEDGGSVSMRDAILRADGGSAAYAGGGSTLMHLSRCVIRDSPGRAVSVNEGAKALLEDCEITGNLGESRDNLPGKP